MGLFQIGLGAVAVGFCLSSTPALAWISEPDEVIGAANSKLFNEIRKSVATIAIERESKGAEAVCSGVLITSQHLVSAMHCFNHVSRIGVLINGKRVRVKRIRQAKLGDLAVLELEEPISASDPEVAPMPPSPECRKLKEGDEVIQAGVGMTRDQKTTSDWHRDFVGLQTKRFAFGGTYMEGRGFHASHKDAEARFERRFKGETFPSGMPGHSDSGSASILVRDGKPHVCGIVDSVALENFKYYGFNIGSFVEVKNGKLQELAKFSDVKTFSRDTNNFSIAGVTDRGFSSRDTSAYEAHQSPANTLRGSPSHQENGVRPRRRR